MSEEEIRSRVYQVTAAHFDIPVESINDATSTNNDEDLVMKYEEEFDNISILPKVPSTVGVAIGIIYNILN